MLTTSDRVGELDAVARAEEAPDAEALVETDATVVGLRDTEGEVV